MIAKNCRAISIDAINSELEIVSCEFIVETLNISSIAQSVKEDYILDLHFFPELEASVLKGMRNPIIVCKNTAEAYKHVQDDIQLDAVEDYDKTKEFLCLFGNQRMVIAKRNGYTQISGVVVSSPFWSIIYHNYLNNEH